MSSASTSERICGSLTCLEPASLLGPLVSVVQVVQVPQVQIIEEIVEGPVTLSAQGAQTSPKVWELLLLVVCLFSETVDRVEGWSPLPAESGPLVRVTTLVVDVPPVVVNSICSCDPLRRSSARRGPRNVGNCVNTIHPAPEIHEHIYVTRRPQRLRNIVHNLKHTFTYAEHNVTNCMSGTTHTDAFIAQY